jgi:hypothetical protein
LAVVWSQVINWANVFIVDIIMDSAPPAKVSFSLKAKAKVKPTTSIPTPVSAFGSFDEEVNSPAEVPAKPGKSGPKSLVATRTVMTKAMKREMEEQQKVDATVYQYDEVYDRLKEAERLAEVAKEEEAKIRQVLSFRYASIPLFLMNSLAQIYRQFTASSGSAKA